MDIPLLNDVVIIFGLSVAVLLACNRLRVPTVVGFLLTGMLAGPHGLGLIKAVHEVEVLAEVGVVLLLFTIGIEFSLKSLLQIRRSVLVGGSLQVLLTLLSAFLLAGQMGRGFGESIFIGFLISLSSTAIVLKLLQERAEVDAPHGRTVLGILIFQDIVVVPMMLLTPLLAGVGGSLGGAMLILLVKGAGVILLVILGSKWVVPRVLYQVARTRSRELFLLSVVVICLAVAWLTHQAGLSLALGAFLAGLIVSESEYSHQALGSILPLQDVFTSLFFVSVGMLLDVEFLLQNLAWIALTALGVLILKTLTAGFAAVLLGSSLRTGVLAGLSLSQIGEFSFILSRTGLENGLLAGEAYPFFLSVSVLTMLTAPLLIAVAPRVAEAVLRLPLPERVKEGFYPVPGVSGEDRRCDLKDHLVVVGYGVNGRNVARAARAAGIPYAIVEMNPETVRREIANGEPIYYGDAIQEAVLCQAGIRAARVAVLAISDPVATRRITALAKRLNPGVCLIVRTRFLREMGPLFEAGADEVVPEEFETSIEIFTRVLAKYLIPRDEIEGFVAEVRSDGYEMFRSLSRESPSSFDLKLHLPDVEVRALRVAPGSPGAGKTLSEMALRSSYAVTLLAIRRGEKTLPNPDGNTRLCAHDILILVGPPDRIAGVAHFFSGTEETRRSEET